MHESYGGGKDGYATFATLPYEDSFILYTDALVSWIGDQPLPEEADAIASGLVPEIYELPEEELSTQRYVGHTGFAHDVEVDCPAFGG